MKRMGSILLGLLLVVNTFQPTMIRAEESEQADTMQVTTERQDSMTSRTREFNADWKFKLNVSNSETPQAVDYSDKDWQQIRLPHDWSIFLDFNQNSPAQNEGGLLDGGTGWYRKSFFMPQTDQDKKVRIRFGGVYMDSTVYVNGTRVGNYPAGYTSFSYDISDYLNYGDQVNLIAVKVVNRQPSSRWYSGSGIYRDVELIVTDPVHIPLYGTYITTPYLKDELANNREATTHIQTKVKNQTTTDQEVVLQYQLTNADGDFVGDQVTGRGQMVTAGSELVFEQNISVAQPALWSTDNPNLYYLITKVVIDDKMVDQTTTRFGYRYMDWTPADGFALNGQYLKFHGVCMHHDQGALGAVANETAIRRQMQIMKQMGVNAIRSTHNQADDKLVAICEEMGLLLIDEAFDTWYQGKKPYDYGRFFERTATHPEAKPGQTWAEFDIKEMVNRDKNSPAIMMYSLGNEIWEASGSPKSVTTVEQLSAWVKQVDPTRYITMGQDQMKDHNAAKLKISERLGAVGLNYAEEQWAGYHREHPEWLIYGSETSSATRSRGVYYDSTRDDISHDASSARKYQQSDFGNDHVGWGRTATSSWRIDRDHKGYAGQFIWTGFDYIGEPTPWHNQQASGAPSKSSYFGIVDTAGFPKNDYYLYQSQWTTKPMLHILPHWNWSAAEKEQMKAQGTNLKRLDDKIPIRIFSNAAQVELFLNEQSLGTKQFTQKQTDYGLTYQEGDRPQQLYLEWLVDYVPGTLRAVAMDAAGQKVAEQEIKTAGKASRVRLYPEQRVIIADNQDLAYIPFVIEDENGTMVPYADNQVIFEASGAGQIVGVDNGNGASQERYQAQADGSWQRRAFSGKGLVIVQAGDQAGNITLVAKSDGLDGDTVSIYTTESASQDILGYEIPVLTVQQGSSEVVLPEQIKAIFGNGQTESVSVSWADYDKEKLNQVGIFYVDGQAEGQSVQIKIIVKGVVGHKPMVVRTAVNQLPVLPTHASIIYSDGMIESKPVAWAELNLADYQTVGSEVIVSGQVPALNQMPVQATVRVVQSLEGAKNIAVRQGQYPIPTASFEAGDKVTAINDGNLSFYGRWTNWVTGGYANAKADWVQLEFEQPVGFDKVGIHFFTDGQTKEPANLEIQTSGDGIDFSPVSNQSQSTGFNVGQGDFNTEYSITFDAVQAKYIRLVMTGQPREDRFKPVGLVEVKVYTPEGEQLSDQAELNSILVDQQPLSNFTADNYSYVVTVDYGKPLPVVTTQQQTGIQVEIIPADETNHYTAKIFTVSEDGQQQRTYSIRFVYGQPQLSQVDLSFRNISQPGADSIRVDDQVQVELNAHLEDGTVLATGDYTTTYQALTNNIRVQDGIIYALATGEAKIKVSVTYQTKTVDQERTFVIDKSLFAKEIIGFEPITVKTEIGIKPVLPSTMIAHYSNGGLDKAVAVDWEPIAPEQYQDYGSFLVYGQVAGTSIYPRVKVEVGGYVTAEAIHRATLVGEQPQLPEQVKVYEANGESTELPVTWQLASVSFEELGLVEVVGDISGITRFQALAQIRVTDQATAAQLISKQVNGFDIPAAIASFTNDGPGSADRVHLVNDGVIDFNNTNPNRWTNWQSNKRPTDWVGILFGQSGDLVQQYVDNLSVGFFEDHGTKLPTEYVIEYFVPAQAPERVLDSYPHIDQIPENALAKSENWQAVSNLEPVSITAGSMNSFRFDKVKTYAIRIRMTAQSNMGLGITEMTVESAAAQLQSSYELSLAINGQPWTDFDPQVVDYQLDDYTEFPTIEATITNNGSVTIVPATKTNGRVAQILAKAEDGSHGRTYRLEFTQSDTEVVAIHFVKTPKTDYIEGQNLVLEPNAIETMDAQGRIGTISMDNPEVVISGYDSAVLGQQTVELTYQGHRLTWVVTVTAAQVPEPEPQPTPQPETRPVESDNSQIISDNKIPLAGAKKLTEEQEKRYQSYQAGLEKAEDQELIHDFMTGQLSVQAFTQKFSQAGMAFLVEQMQAEFDEPIADWYKSDLAILMAKGYFKGYPDRTFRGENPITGQEYLALLVRAGEWELPTVESEDWFAPYYEILKQKQLLNGVLFDIKKQLSREEVAYLTTNWLEAMAIDSRLVLAGANPNRTPFSDIEQSNAAYRMAIEMVQDQAIFEGYEDGSFQPQNKISRQEIVKVIYRLLAKQE